MKNIYELVLNSGDSYEIECTLDQIEALCMLIDYDLINYVEQL